MMASESSSRFIDEASKAVREPKSISAGKADGVSREDDCGVAAFATDDEGDGRWLVEAKTDVGEEANDGTALLKELSPGSPFRGTEKVKLVFLRETFSSCSRFRSSLRC
jgi:hypothetical protein